MDFEEIGTVMTFGEVEPGSLIILSFGDACLVACKVDDSGDSQILALQPSDNGYDSVGIFAWADQNTSVLLLRNFHIRPLLPYMISGSSKYEYDPMIGQIIQSSEGYFMKAVSNQRGCCIDLVHGIYCNVPTNPFVVYQGWEIRHKTNKAIKPIMRFPFEKELPSNDADT